jgi:uncharacterized protein
MSLTVNLRHLIRDSICLEGELPVAELELDMHDEMVQAKRSLRHDLEVQLLNQNLLVRGTLQLTLDCECVRCLKPFQHKIELTDWACHLPLEGDDRVAVVDDSVDLTPFIREDFLLAFPAHPVCDPECGGLTGKPNGSKKNKATRSAPAGPSAWAELDKLKFRS